MNLQPSNKLADKILVIGGSTYNQGTPCKIRNALINTGFLEEWAVVFANHDYFNLERNDSSRIHQEFQGLNVVLVQEPKDYLVNKNEIYVLQDCPTWIQTFTTQNNSPMIKASNSGVEDRNWFETIELAEGLSSELYNVEDYDASASLRCYQPCIDKVMVEVSRSNLSKIAGLILCGKDGDGAYGLREIEAKAGETAVQMPCECCMPDVTDSMPNTALRLKQNYRKLSLANSPSSYTLTGWLSHIK